MCVDITLRRAGIGFGCPLVVWKDDVVTDLRITDAVDDVALAELRERVIAYNLAVTGISDGRSLGCYVRNADGELIAGLDGFSWGGYIKIEWLWVREDHRGGGLGSQIIRAVEAEATRRGCAVVRVDSHTFQAPGFYEKLGYERVGFAVDTPVGHGEVFFLKRLSTDVH
jgi:ribosomal protein S18 acetylase RimI-like enzyme